MKLKNLEIIGLCGKTIFTGVSGGKAIFAKVGVLLGAHPFGAPVVLNFAGVDVISGSSLRHLFQCISEIPACSRSVLVLANLSEDALAESDLVAEAMRIPYIAAQVAGETLVGASVRGMLDEKAAQALKLVIDSKEADAQTVSEKSGERTVVTVWNNRLVSLHAMGLLQERKVGKRKFYSPAIEGMTYGN